MFYMMYIYIFFRSNFTSFTILSISPQILHLSLFNIDVLIVYSVTSVGFNHDSSNFETLFWLALVKYIYYTPEKGYSALANL